MNMSPPTHYTLRCRPAGGTLPDPVAVCSRLLAAPDLFGPPPTNHICAMGMMGTGKVVLSGTYLGLPVDETIADSGCALPRWTEIKYVLGLPGL
jgi:hypothetical protein